MTAKGEKTRRGPMNAIGPYKNNGEDKSTSLTAIPLHYLSRPLTMAMRAGFGVTAKSNDRTRFGESRAQADELGMTTKDEKRGGLIAFIGPRKISVYQPFKQSV